ALEVDLPRNVAAGEEQAVDTVKGAVEAAAVGEVTDGQLHIRPQHAGGLAGVADERPDRHSPPGQSADDMPAHVAGRTGHQNSHRISPPLGGMFGFRQNTLDGSYRFLSAISLPRRSPYAVRMSAGP